MFSVFFQETNIMKYSTIFFFHNRCDVALYSTVYWWAVFKRKNKISTVGVAFPATDLPMDPLQKLSAK